MNKTLGTYSNSVAQHTIPHLIPARPSRLTLVGEIMNIIDKLFGINAAVHASDDDRPVKWVQEKENVWRVVYAD